MLSIVTKPGSLSIALIVKTTYWPQILHNTSKQKYSTNKEGAAAHELLNIKTVLKLCLAVNEKSQRQYPVHRDNMQHVAFSVISRITYLGSKQLRRAFLYSLIHSVELRLNSQHSGKNFNLSCVRLI